MVTLILLSLIKERNDDKNSTLEFNIGFVLNQSIESIDSLQLQTSTNTITQTAAKTSSHQILC